MPWLLSRPSPAPSLPQGPLQPWGHPCPHHLSPKSVTAPQTSVTSLCCAQAPSHACSWTIPQPPKLSEPHCRASSPRRPLCRPSLSQSCALPAGGDYSLAQPSGTCMCVRTTGLCKRCVQQQTACEHPRGLYWGWERR